MAYESMDICKFYKVYKLIEKVDHDRRPRPRISVPAGPKHLLVSRALVNRFSFCFHVSTVQIGFSYVLKGHMNR